MSRGHTPKLCFPGFELNYESIDKNNKIYDTLKIVFESKHFRKKKFFLEVFFNLEDSNLGSRQKRLWCMSP